jgi:hypothetical protein
VAKNMTDQAIEVLMGRYDIDVQAAQALLSQLSTDHPMEDVAGRLVNPSPTSTTAGHSRTGVRSADIAADTVSDTDQRHVQIAALICDVYGRSPVVETALDELTAAAPGFVPGAQYAGITIIARRGNIQTPSAIGPHPGVLDMIQKRHRQGPCLEAIRAQRTVRVDDLHAETRWPSYRQDALSQTPIRSVLSFAMSAGRHTHDTHAAFSFFAEHPHAFDASAEELGFVYATHTALAWMALRRELQFRQALVSRDVISQAKGMLMERHHIDAGEAFERLRELSQHHNVPVTEISRAIIGERTA